jgi:modulator of FtsH protease
VAAAAATVDQMEAWHDFFIALVGAIAALVGLLFVALSINLAQILAYTWLPARGAQTLVVLTGALVQGALPLLPAASSKPVALIALGIAIVTWGLSVALVRSFIAGVNAQKAVTLPPMWAPSYALFAQVATLPAVAGAALLLAGHADGYYWIAAGMLATVVFALYNAWVLLVEIMR